MGRTSTRRHQAIVKKYRQAEHLTCGLCHKPIDTTLPPGDPGAVEADHIIPVAQGGTDDPGNYQPTHRACNLAKGDGRRRTRRTFTSRNWLD